MGNLFLRRKIMAMFLKTKTHIIGRVIGIILAGWVLLFCTPVPAAETKKDTCEASDYAALLNRNFLLVKERSLEPRFYEMVTKVVYFEPDGKQKPYVNLKLLLKCAPAGKSPKDGFRYTCVKQSYQQAEQSEVAIPAMADWSYVYGKANPNNVVLGIEHSKFQGLKDAQGNPLPPEMSYSLYNMFIDFHAFCNVFAERTHSGKGIQHLQQMGQEIVHESAYTEPSVHLAGNIDEGSYFKNGKVTLDFKGISVVDAVPCALVGFDSGKSSFKMAFSPAPDVDAEVVGASHYWGDLYIELATNWVRKCTMGELVVTQTQIGKQQTINGVMERESLIRSLEKKEFEKISKENYS
jgi:hypothetical protein